MGWLKQALSKFREGVQQIERSERDEAHLATRGDRPFPGCRPEAPYEMEAKASANPDAKPPPTKG